MSKWFARAAWLAALVSALAALALWRMPELYAWWWYLRAGHPEMTNGALELHAPLHWFDDYYVVADLGAGAYAIGEPRYGQCNFSYLIVGSQRALLFDSGPGLRDIRPVVHSLTQLPVLALPSHLHFDHVGDLSLFPAVALPDLPALRRQVRAAGFVLGFYQYLGFVEGFRRPGFTVTQWIRPDAAIDVGGRELQLLNLPGHTPESVVLLDRAAQRVFAGDFIYPSSIYAFTPGASLANYALSARRLSGLLGEHSLLYGAHGCDPLPRVEVPVLHPQDVTDLERALSGAATSARGGRGFFPREFAVNAHMQLLAGYPWMAP